MKEPPKTQLDPSPSKVKSSSSDWPLFWVKGGVFTIGLCALVFWLTRPLVIRGHKHSDLTQSVSHARQIGLALAEFELEYGKFPDEATAAKLREKTRPDLKLGTNSSNDFFRQLLAARVVGNEDMFYANIAGSRKPDGIIAGSRALEKGEVGFSYLAGLNTRGNPSRPVLVTPLLAGSNRFDPTRFDGRAVILKMDNSVASTTISENGSVIARGINLLDPGNLLGGHETWKLVWPE